MNSDVSVALVEDEPLYRRLLVELCQACAVNVRGAFGSVAEAAQALPALDPDIALIDLGLPDAPGSELIATLAQRAPRTQCLVLTKFDDDAHLFRALECGATGYLLKDALDLPRLRAALVEAMNNGAPMSASIARRVVAAFHAPPAHGGGATLTGRESEILDWLAAGHGAKHISRLLGISYETVRCHQKSIYRKLQVNSVVQAVASASSSGRWRVLSALRRSARGG